MNKNTLKNLALLLLIFVLSNCAKNETSPSLSVEDHNRNSTPIEEFLYFPLTKKYHTYVKQNPFFCETVGPAMGSSFPLPASAKWPVVCCGGGALFIVGGSIQGILYPCVGAIDLLSLPLRKLSRAINSP